MISEMKNALGDILAGLGASVDGMKGPKGLPIAWLLKSRPKLTAKNCVSGWGSVLWGQKSPILQDRGRSGVTPMHKSIDLRLEPEIGGSRCDVKTG